jgi:hypothetical protein
MLRRLTEALPVMLLQPRRFLTALSATAGVGLSAALVQVLAPAGEAPLLPAMMGGLVAFNLLLFFPPGQLYAPWTRPLAGLAVSALPLPLAPLLYAVSPALADAALIAAAGASVLMRPRGVPVAQLSLLLALNLLIPLVLGGDRALVALGALAGVVGAPCAAAADAVVARLLRTRSPGFERRLLRVELARFLATLLHAWRDGSGQPEAWVDPVAGRLRLLRAELAPDLPAGGALPPDAMLPSIAHCAEALRQDSLTPEAAAAVAGALEAVAQALRADAAGAARAAIAALHEAALRPQGTVLPPARMLGLALMLGDLVEQSMSPIAAPPVAA